MTESRVASNRGSAGEPSVRPIPVLIRFRHGLGDAVQLTAVLRHLQRYRPEWEVHVAALLGKHSALRGLCAWVGELGGDSPPTAAYERVFDLDWPECTGSFKNSPSTKLERCLREVFDIEPDRDLVGYRIHPSDEDEELAERYLRRDVGLVPDGAGRFPAALLHYEGNTSPTRKNLPLSVAREWCEAVLEAGLVPIILDWDGRSPLPDQRRIFNPHFELELWRGHGTGDAGVLAALIDKSALFVGVDSGPLHVAAATGTPAIGVWTGHHPLHYLAPAANVVNLVPENHTQLLRGEADTGRWYFERHYRFATYRDLRASLLTHTERLLETRNAEYCFRRSFWLRRDNVEQDLVVVNDVFERDAYGVSRLPWRQPVVVDVGAHIGCFAAQVRRHQPHARIFAIECCPENLAALRRNAGGFATIVPAALTYERDVALLNAVYPDCVTTGGSVVASRAEIAGRVAAGELGDEAQPGAGGYWGDLRPLATLTLEELVAEHQIQEIDLLKLDCEGSEFSILRHTTLLDRIRFIIGEYHGRDAFARLVAERFSDWDLTILKEGELGLFWLRRPEQPMPARGRD